MRQHVGDSGVLDLSPGVSRKSDGWVGLGCCELAISAECRRECRQVRDHEKSVSYFVF